MSMTWKVSTILWLVAAVLFLVSAVGVSIGSISLAWLGLAAFAGGFVLESWKM